MKRVRLFQTFKLWLQYNNCISRLLRTIQIISRQKILHGHLTLKRLLACSRIPTFRVSPVSRDVVRDDSINSRPWSISWDRGRTIIISGSDSCGFSLSINVLFQPCRYMYILSYEHYPMYTGICYVDVYTSQLTAIFREHYDIFHTFWRNRFYICRKYIFLQIITYREYKMNICKDQWPD